MRVRVVICRSPVATGDYAAAEVTARLNAALREKDRARLLLSTGASQFETLRSLVRRRVDWQRVDAFHLDEYVGLEAGHPASFRHYLRERVAELVPLRMHYVDPSSAGAIEELAALVASAPMDAALIGIGENGHIAFNDPPANFETTAPYLEVDLDERCRAQQVGEGWFASIGDVPRRAVTMSVREILRARAIISAVPHAAKAEAVRALLTTTTVSPDLPASALRQHGDVTVVLDLASAQRLPGEVWDTCLVL